MIVASSPVGGIRTYLRYVLSYVDRGKYAVTLVACRNSESRQLADGLPAHVALKLAGSEASCFLRIALEVVRGRPHVVNSQGFRAAVLAFVPCILFRRKHALTIHGIVEDRFLSGRLERLRRLIWMRMLRSVDVFVAVGRDIQTHVQRRTEGARLRKCRWVVIPNGIDIAEFAGDRGDSRTELLRKLGLTEANFVFGFFGRFMPQKGFDLIVEAMSILRADSRAGSFMILAVGSGDYVRESIALVHRRGLKDRFIFMPAQNSIAPLLAGCDCVLMPSRWEAFSLLAAECLCTGTPLIASDCIGLREVVEGTPAIIIPSENPSALAEAMIKVASDPEARQRAQAFRKSAAERFDVSLTAAQLMVLWDELAFAPRSE